MVVLGIVYIICCLTLVDHVDGVNNSWPSYEINGKQCYYCSAGFYWTGHCQTALTQAQCTPCPRGTHQKTKNIALYCGHCTKCDHVVRNYEVAAELVPCSTLSDTVCGCKEAYHFRLDHGGMGVGYCHKNSMCPVGSGLLETASNFSDTKCIECERGFTFSSVNAYEPCMQCTVVCPNSTHFRHSCNTTHDIDCEINTDHTESTKEKTSGKSSFSLHKLGIGLGTTAGIVVILVIVLLVVRKKRRTRNNNTQKKSLSETPPKIPQWMEKCISGESVSWPKLFGICPGYILPDWESFVRDLFILSLESEKGHQAVEFAKEAFEKERVEARVYDALERWRRKCVTCGKETQMFYVFCDAVHQHKRKQTKLPKFIHY